MICTVSKSIEFDAGHRVPMHASKCRNPHGHRYKVTAYVEGPILSARGEADDGMVVDFGAIKGVLTEQVHDVLDHGFMVWAQDDELLAWFKEPDVDPGWKFTVMRDVPTAENLAVWCYSAVRPFLPAPLVLRAIEVYETPTSIARYEP